MLLCPTKHRYVPTTGGTTTAAVQRAPQRTPGGGRARGQSASLAVNASNAYIDNDDYFGAGSGDDDDDDEEDECDMTSLNAVLSRCPSFAEAKSMLEEIVAEAGHLVLLSSKYHCECAGQGIEYCFGRSKWWFRSHNRLSTVNLERNSKAAFGIDVVTIGHVRKFARKCRLSESVPRWHKGFKDRE